MTDNTEAAPSGSGPSEAEAAADGPAAELPVADGQTPQEPAPAEVDSTEVPPGAAGPASGAGHDEPGAAEQSDSAEPHTPEPAHEEDAERPEERERPTITSPPQMLGSLSRAQMTRDEIAAAVTYFTTVPGFNAPLNFVTPKLFQARISPIANLSLHYCEQLLRDPYNGGDAKQFVDPALLANGWIPHLGPAQMQEILSYRVAPSDDVDFSLESFYMLGATGPTDTVSIDTVCDFLFTAYGDLEEHLAYADDYKLLAETLEAKKRRAEQARTRRDNDGDDDAPRTVTRTKSAPKTRREPLPALPPREDVRLVLRMCLDNPDADSLTIEDWRGLMVRLRGLQFLDHRESIRKAVK